MKFDTESPKGAQPSQPSKSALAPSGVLLAAAILGLVGIQACSETPQAAEADPANCATTATTGAGGSTTSATTGAGGGGGEGASKVISEEEGNMTFAEVATECETRGGFVQVHAACAGTNMCAGFSYGDWDPGVKMEHSCAGVNGCSGISCIILPPDSGKTGKEVYETALPETGPRVCTNCHADWSGEEPDYSKFILWVLEGSPRDETNWLDYPKETQAKIVAFGKRGYLDDGTAYSNMAAYHGVFARGEIERAVDYVRTLDVIVKVIKTHD